MTVGGKAGRSFVVAWTWVSDLLTPDNKPKFYWNAHCPYKVTCPSHQPEPHSKKPKLKFVQKVSPMVYEYRCGHCGCLVMFGMLQPNLDNRDLLHMNPALRGGKADYRV